MKVISYCSSALSAAFCACAVAFSASGGVVATGGDISMHDGRVRIHTFRSNGKFVVESGGTVQVLLIGGGGGGGAASTGGGGGGGGGFLYTNSFALAAGEYDIVVGEGGAGAHTNLDATITAAQNGGSSSAFGLSVAGGGGGGSALTVAKPGSDGDTVGLAGASGGGGATRYEIKLAMAVVGGAGIDGIGYHGGTATNGAAAFGQSHIHCWAGGGGGAGGPGGDGVCTKDEGTTSRCQGEAGVGGIGRICSITGSDVYYAGGGGGGFVDYTYVNNSTMPAGTVAGGDGGGGAGSGNPSAKAAHDGLPGTDGLGGGGGGGGGFAAYVGSGGNGGDGVVIIAYEPHFEDTGFVSAAGGDINSRNRGYHVFTFTNNGMFTVTGNACVDVLVIGGGGGGGASQTGGGGGGGGGFVYREGVCLQEGTYPVVVGAGGAGAYSSAATLDSSIVPAENGSDSSAFGILAYGGGGGGSEAYNYSSAGQVRTDPISKGLSGSSGGGGATRYTSARAMAVAGGDGIDGQGYHGGSATNGAATANQSHIHCWAGGGGGAGGPGGDGVCTKDSGTGSAGVGGIGRICSITGKDVYYAGGGGGGFADYSYPDTGETVPGGEGGGGKGSGAKTNTAQYPGGDGVDGLGGGGGGGGGFGSNIATKGGDGGDGVVIIRCKIRIGAVITIR